MTVSGARIRIILQRSDGGNPHGFLLRSEDLEMKINHHAGWQSCKAACLQSGALVPRRRSKAATGLEMAPLAYLDGTPAASKHRFCGYRLPRGIRGSVP